ncbi:MAG: KamA family radical SAM protein [Thermodesulfobacteriota bacterium]
MELWEKRLAQRITSLEKLGKRFPIDSLKLRPVVERYPLSITPYYFNLIKDIGDPIWRQCVPDIRELEDDHLSEDPLHEESYSPVPNLLHRYPDRVLLLVSLSCPTFCRFCTRKNRILSGKTLSVRMMLPFWKEYLKKDTKINEVILSGGEPLMLSDDELETILSTIRSLSHIRILRINTRIPVTLPERITLRLSKRLKRYHPIFINTHFNHPQEITQESSEACAILSDAGIPLGNQTVLLRGVNDEPQVMKELMKKLLTLRIRPYYLHHMDLVKGTSHFRTSINQGLKIMKHLIGNISGMGIPYYVIDLPGGKGKVPLLPHQLMKKMQKLSF